MKRLFLVLLLASRFPYSYASDSIRIVMSAKILHQGDTLDFACRVPEYEKLKLLNATLNVWIENISTHSKWKFRYPMINGDMSASLAIGKNIPDGNYAVNFLVQHGFFRITGELADPQKNDSSLIYMMIAKNHQSSYVDRARVLPDGSFRLKNTLFADSAYFIFSPAKKVKNNYLAIHIETPLDSVYVPVVQGLTFLQIHSSPNEKAESFDSSNYVFNSADPIDTGSLPGVTVTAQFKTRVQQYDATYSKGLFQRNDAMVFDGLESDQISHSISILNFLQSKVPGLTIVQNEDGREMVKWRNEIVDIYIDEFRVDAEDNNLIAPSEVAMIKVYRPPAMLSSLSGSAGAIAIYTKKGEFADSNKYRHNFIVKGYTKIESVWE